MGTDRPTVEPGTTAGSWMGTDTPTVEPGTAAGSWTRIDIPTVEPGTAAGSWTRIDTNYAITTELRHVSYTRLPPLSAVQAGCD